MATTPRGIPLADGATIVQPIQTPLNAIANAADTAITNAVSGLEQNAFIGTNAERLAFTGPQLRNGITWFVTDNSARYERIAGAWVLRSPFATATGRVSSVTLAPGTRQVTAVTFPVGKFTVPPVVTVTQVGTDIRDATVGAWKVTATGMELWRGSMSIVSRTVAAEWTAIQMTPSSATG